MLNVISTLINEAPLIHEINLTPLPGAIHPLKLSVQHPYYSVGPFQWPDFQNNQVGAKARVGVQQVGFRGSVATTAPIMDELFLQNLTPKQAVAKSRLNIIA
jgi:hypothetical protein